MNIIIIFAVLILVGIIVGSNLFPTMTVVILNQPTVALPIGVWLIIAIGAGFLSSLLIQLSIFIDRRLRQRQIQQAQSRDRQQDEDLFTSVAPAYEADNSSSAKPDTITAKTSRFKSYRSNFTDRFTNPSSSQSTTVDDSDDWDAAPVTNRQLDWEDLSPPRQQNRQSPPPRSTIGNDFSPERQSQQLDADRDPAPVVGVGDSLPLGTASLKENREPQPTSREVYDADFRLIQPPYKQPLASEFDDNSGSFRLEDTDTNEDEDDTRSTASVKPTSPNRPTPSGNLEDEDWGFDFESRDPPVRTK